MKRTSLFRLLGPMLLVSMHTIAQPGTVRSIEPCDCQVKIDSSFRTQCAYLIVPENRNAKNGKTIKLPFIVVESKNPKKRKDPLLFTGGGPGQSSLRWAAGITRGTVINDRDCIAFEQRGTRYAVPHLWSGELDEAIRESYRKNLDKDSMMVVGTKRYKQALEARGIDLSGYNTDETVSDIHDLTATLGLDSVNLSGGSYSGGLMLAVLQRDPARVRSLVLDSPLPTFVPIDEDEPANFMESMHILFERVARDSANKAEYRDLKMQFETYFNAIADRVFTIRYQEKGRKEPQAIQYTRRELLGILVNAEFAEIPKILIDFIQGGHEPYIRRYLDRVFERDMAPSGMRISVYCADQTAYHSERVAQQAYDAYPYLKDFHINDVYRELCDCWNVPPVKPETKQPFYSKKPALLADGELDNACRPLYIDMIHHYMPNSQRLLFRNRGHGVGGPDMHQFTRDFLNNPYQKLKSDKPEILVY